MDYSIIQRMTTAQKQVGIAVIYFVLGLLDFHHSESALAINSIEVGAGLAVGVLLIGGARYAWGIFAGNMLGYLGKIPFGLALITLSTEILEALAVVWMLACFTNFNASFRVLRDYLSLIAYSAVSAAIAGGVWVAAKAAGGFYQHGGYLPELAHWWLAHTLGIILFTPLVLALWHAKKEPAAIKPWAEFVLLLGLVFLGGQVIFFGWANDMLAGLELEYLMFLLVIWAAVRFGVAGTAVIANVIGMHAVVGALYSSNYFINKTGQVFPINYWLFVMALSVVGMALAIFLAGRKQAEEALQQSETKFRKLYDSTGEAVFLMNKGGFTDCNQAAVMMMGLASRDEIVGKRPGDFSPAKQPGGMDSTVLANQYIGLAVEKGSHRFEWVCKRADTGRLIVVDMLLSAIKLADETIIQAIARDITEQRSAIENFEKFFNLIPEMACIASSDGYFKKINHAWQALGYTEQEILASPFLDFIHPDDRNATMKEVSLQLNDQTTYKFVNRYRCKNGSYRFLEWCASQSMNDGLLYGAARDITDSRQLEEKLLRSYEAYSSILTTTLDGFWVIGPEGRLMDVNDRYTEQSGYSREELLNMRIPDVEAFESAAETVAHIRSVVEKGGDQFETMHRRKDGSLWHVEVSTIFQSSDGGKFYAFLRDITGRKKAEEELRQTKARYDYAATVGKVGTWDWQPRTGSLLWNDETFRLLGFEPGSVAPSFQLFLEVVHPDDRTLISTSVQAALYEHKPYTLDCRIVASSHEILFCHIEGKVEFDAEEKPIRMLGTIQDITARKQAEEKLKESEEQLQSILNNASAVIFVKDLLGRYLLVNSRYEELFHISNAAIQGKTDYDIFPQEAARKFREADQKVVESGKPVEAEEQVPQDGGIHTYISVKFPLYHTSGEIYAICGIATDITDRKAAEQQVHNLAAHIVEVREEEKARIAREIHDELGSTLAALKIDGYWLVRKLGAVDGASPLVERLEAMTQRIDIAVNATRRIIDNMRPAVLDDLGLLAAIEWLAEDFQKHTGIECSVKCIEDEANLDEQRSIALFRIFQEALTNIARHSGATRVRVEFLHDESKAMLAISDNGCGVPENHKIGLKSYGMMGMRERMEQLGGSLKLSSSEGGGLSLMATLPLSVR